MPNSVARLPKPNRLSPAERYRADNLTAARIILEQPDRYRGLMLDWARRVIECERPATEAI